MVGSPPRDGHDRRPRFLDRGDRLVHRHHLIQHRLVLPDPPAADAGQVAHLQRLQHRNQRKAPPPPRLLLKNVTGQADGQLHRPFRPLGGSGLPRTHRSGHRVSLTCADFFSIPPFPPKTRHFHPRQYCPPGQGYPKPDVSPYRNSTPTSPGASIRGAPRNPPVHRPRPWPKRAAIRRTTPPAPGAPPPR